jgi:hypothetical protein
VVRPFAVADTVTVTVELGLSPEIVDPVQEDALATVPLDEEMTQVTPATLPATDASNDTVPVVGDEALAERF